MYLSKFKSLFAAGTLMLALSAGAFAQNATVRVVHGIPGQDIGPGVDAALPVDILVNDAVCLLSGFTFGAVEGPYTLPEGTARVIAHHTAAAPAVDINVSFGFPRNTATIPNATNGAQAAAELPVGNLNVGFAPAGTRDTLFVRTARLRSDLTYVAYAVGSLTNGTFDLIFVPLGGLQNLTIRN